MYTLQTIADQIPWWAWTIALLVIVTSIGTAIEKTSIPKGPKS